VRIVSHNVDDKEHRISLPTQYYRIIQYSKNKEFSKKYNKTHVLHQLPLKFCHDINFVLLFFVEKQKGRRKVTVLRDIITFKIKYSHFCRILSLALCNRIISLRLDRSVPISLSLSDRYISHRCLHLMYEN
jgi:hypothetical protein